MVKNTYISRVKILFKKIQLKINNFMFIILYKILNIKFNSNKVQEIKYSKKKPVINFVLKKVYFLFFIFLLLFVILYFKKNLIFIKCFHFILTKIQQRLGNARLTIFII